MIFHTCCVTASHLLARYVWILIAGGTVIVSHSFQGCLSRGESRHISRRVTSCEPARCRLQHQSCPGSTQAPGAQMLPVDLQSQLDELQRYRAREGAGGNVANLSDENMFFWLPSMILSGSPRHHFAFWTCLLDIAWGRGPSSIMPPQFFLVHTCRYMQTRPSRTKFPASSGGLMG